MRGAVDFQSLQISKPGLFGLEIFNDVEKMNGKISPRTKAGVNVDASLF